MIPLKDALESINAKNRPTIKKYLEKAKIDSWDNIDKSHLARFATTIKGAMCASSAHTTFAVFKAFLGKFEEGLDLPKDWRKMLDAKVEPIMTTYLTAEEVELFGEASVESDRERTVRDGFYLSCKTGLRHSDLMRLRPSNFQPMEGGGWFLNYVSKKTKIHATVPCSNKTKEKAEWLHKNGVSVSLTYNNDMVRELAKRAGIDTEVSVFLHGEELVGPKYQFLTSHSARRSFCTVLSDFDTGLMDIMRMAGHKDPAMTARYIVRHDVKVNEKAEKFLM